MTAIDQLVPARPAAPDAAFAIRAERASEIAAREALLDVSFGDNRRARTCHRLREGCLPADGLAFTALCGGRLVGTLRLWHADAGGRRALMLGPLAVDPALRKFGIGAALMRHALSAAKSRGHGAIVLLGDAPYYAQFGFCAEKAESLSLPGPFERHRLLGLELRPGTLNGAFGLIMPNRVSEPARADARAA